jgi:hypothetical protein
VPAGRVRVRPPASGLDARRCNGFDGSAAGMWRGICGAQPLAVRAGA